MTFNLRKLELTKIASRIPICGIILFIGMYIYASTLYPGGSQSDLTSKGYDWFHNYWCNLMNEKAMNGTKNPARPIAISALVILCLSLMVFFTQFARSFVESKFWKVMINAGGVLSMFFAILMFTDSHDLMTIVSSIFGLAAVIGIIKEIYSSKLHFFKITGIFCIVLLAVNNYVYYSLNGIEYLPLLQKITLGIVLAWIAGLSYVVGKGRGDANV